MRIGFPHAEQTVYYHRYSLTRLASRNGTAVRLVGELDNDAEAPHKE
jgi:hypothetical protein